MVEESVGAMFSPTGSSGRGLFGEVGKNYFLISELLYVYQPGPDGHIFNDSLSIRRRNSSWKVNPRGNQDIDLMSIGFSKSTKYRWVLHVDFSMSFRRQIDVTSALAVFIPLFSNIFSSGKLFWYNAGSL